MEALLPRLRDFTEKTAWQKTCHAVSLLYAFFFLLLRWAAAHLNALYIAGDSSGQSSSNCMVRSAADLTSSSCSLEGTCPSLIVKVLVIIEPPCKQIEQTPLPLEQSITLYHIKINLINNSGRYKQRNCRLVYQCQITCSVKPRIVGCVSHSRHIHRALILTCSYGYAKLTTKGSG